MSISSEITRIQNGVSTQSASITQIRTALINRISLPVPAIQANSLYTNSTALQTILSSINSLDEYPLTTYKISDFEAESNARRDGAIITILGSTENSLFLTVDPTKIYLVAYNSVNCGFTGLSGGGSWATLFDYQDEGDNVLIVTGATYWYFYPLESSENTYELHTLNIVDLPLSNYDGTVV